MSISPTDTQKLVVREHFRQVSTAWGSRYREQPQRLSDLDLVLRREHIQEVLRPICEAAAKLRILDLGCGTGDVLDGLPRERLRVIGMDLVPEMAGAAARAHPRDAFAAADAGAIPLAGGSIDVVICSGMLEYVPDPACVLAGIWWVLRPGGHLILSVPNRSSWLRKLSNVEIRAERAAIRLVHRLCGRESTDDLPRYSHAQWSLPRISELLQQAGFHVDCVRFNTYGLWGRLGRSRVNLAFCRWMTCRFNRAGFISRNAAFTMVLRARA